MIPRFAGNDWCAGQNLRLQDQKEECSKRASTVPHQLASLVILERAIAEKLPISYLNLCLDLSSDGKDQLS
jgi:hypothetical protein